MRYAYGTRQTKVKFGPGRSAALFKNISNYSKIGEALLSETIMFMMTDASRGGEKPMTGFLSWFFGALLTWNAYHLPHSQHLSIIV